MKELQNEDGWDYINFIKIKPDMFYKRLQRRPPQFEKNDIFYRKAINSGPDYIEIFCLKEDLQEFDVWLLCSSHHI